MILWPLALICLNYIPVCKNFTGKLIPYYLWPFSYNITDVTEQQHAIFVSKMGLRERLSHIYISHRSVQMSSVSLYEYFKQKKHLHPILHSPSSHIPQQLLLL
jgi:hypothetical protein